MKKVIVVIFALILSFNANSQEVTDVIEAFKESYELEASGEYAHAINKLAPFQDIKNYEYEVCLRLGYLKYLSGLFTESVSFYSKSIKNKPMSIEARLGYVIPAAQLGNWEQVRNQYEKILEIDPKNSTANYRLGSIYYGKKNFEKAYTFFETVVNMYPFDYDSILMLAWTNYQLGKLREAEILFNKVLMYSPGNESATEGLNLIK